MLTAESRPSPTSPVRSNWQSEPMKARFNDHVITVRDVPLPNGRTLPEGTHGFVIEAFEDSETYEIQFDLDGDPVLVIVLPVDFGVT
jgi:hypothetical protein